MVESNAQKEQVTTLTERIATLERDRDAALMCRDTKRFDAMEAKIAMLETNVQHATSYPYVQRGNTVEAQVRKVKNAARAAIMDNPITNHAEWHNLYPLVIVRLNTMLSKYGASRELIHFQDTLHTHIGLGYYSYSHIY